jgi:hypothetical protein
VVLCIARCLSDKSPVIGSVQTAYPLSVALDFCEFYESLESVGFHIIQVFPILYNLTTPRRYNLGCEIELWFFETKERVVDDPVKALRPILFIQVKELVPYSGRKYGRTPRDSPYILPRFSCVIPDKVVDLLSVMPFLLPDSFGFFSSPLFLLFAHRCDIVSFFERLYIA